MFVMPEINKNRIPWLIQLVYDFPYAMDLVDEHGTPDHDKMLPAFAAIAFVVFIFMNPTPSWEAMIAWIVAGGYIYGFSAWRLAAERVLNGKQIESGAHREAAPEAPTQGD